MLRKRTVRRNVRSAAVVAIIALGGSACADDSAPPNNLSVGAITIVTPTPRIAHPLALTVSLTADRDQANVSLSLFAIDRTDDPNVDVRQVPIDTVVVENVAAGTQDYALEVVIPASVESEGDYYIGVDVDPLEEIPELDEEDNLASVEVVLADSNLPNIILTELALDRTALIVRTDEYEDQVDPAQGDVYNADAGGVITIGADGLKLDETVDIEAFAILRISRSDTETTHDVPLYLWHSALQRYTYAYGIDPDTGLGTATEWLPMGTFTPRLSEIEGETAALDDVVRNTEHMDFYIPGRLGDVLEEQLRYPPCTRDCSLGFDPPRIPPPDLTEKAIADLKAFLFELPFSGIRGDESAGIAVLDFEVCVQVRATDSTVVDSETADNETCREIGVFLPPLPPGTPLYDTGGYVPSSDGRPIEPQASANGFATKSGNGNFAFNLDFNAGATADYRGYIEEATAGVPVTLFGASFDFMRMSVRAQLVPDYLGKPESEQSGFSYDIVFLNQVIDSMPPTITAVETSTTLYSKAVEVEKQLFVGPVPVVVGASAGGSFGIHFSFGFNDDEPPIFGDKEELLRLGSTIEPFATIEAQAFAGVGIKGVFVAGVEGILTLLDERLVFFVGVDIDVITDGYDNDNGDVEFIITQLFELSNVFTGPQGHINLFAEYVAPKVKTCKWGFVRFKCITLSTIRATKNLYSTPALFRRRDVLLEFPWEAIDVVIVDGQPAYYDVDQP